MPNHNAVPEPEQLDREIKVLELRRAGLTWQRIAEEVGYADHSGAYAAYKRAIKRTTQQAVDELRTQELDRIDRLQLAAWPSAMKGDTKAILAIARLIHERAKLTGLYMPIKIQQDVTTWNGDESVDRAVRDLAALLTANDAISAGESPMGEAGSAGEATTTGDGLADMADPVGPRLGQDPNRSGVASVGSDTPTEIPMGDSSQDLR